MAPYRDHKRSSRAAPEPGLVTDMVRQFADAYAFLRELVQNGLDAGASRIDVRLSHDGRNLVTAVHDDGYGMTQETIEGPLLTLFASTKEGDSRSIGKYGVGLMSVFALDPDAVLVETWREEGSYLLRLERDHTYVLEAAAPRQDSGTNITIVVPSKSEAYAGQVERCREALRSWCRHARCPIHLVVALGPGVTAARERIDEAFSLAAAVTVQHIEEDEHIVVGYAAGTNYLPGAEALLEGHGTFAGFYNRGLTLHETTASLDDDLSSLRFKAQSPVLSHTLSRDNVRRDDSFERLTSRVRELAKEHLPLELARALAESATKLAAGLPAPTFNAQFLAATFHLDPSQWLVPLWHVTEGEATASLKRIADSADTHPIVFAKAPSALTEALSQKGVSVVRCASTMHEGLTPAELQFSAHRRFGRECRNVKGHYAVATPRDAPDCHRLLEELGGALAAAGAEVATVRLCTTMGLPLRRSALPMPVDAEGPTVIAPGDLERWTNRWGAHRRALWIDRDDLAFQRVLTRAGQDLVTAATLFARYVILEMSGHIADDDSDALLEHTLFRDREASP